MALNPAGSGHKNAHRHLVQAACDWNRVYSRDRTLCYLGRAVHRH